MTFYGTFHDIFYDCSKGSILAADVVLMAGVMFSETLVVLPWRG